MSSWAKAGAYMGLALVTPLSGWLCYKAGEYVDAQGGTHHWALVGLLVGCGLGMYETYRQAMRIEGLDKKK